MAAEGGDWGICAVSLRSPAARDQLVPQGGCYTSVTLGPEGAEHRVIGAIAEVLVAPEDPAAVLARMADPAVRVVSLTITEKGYCHAPSTGRLRLDDPDIVHDLAHPDAPRSALGFLVEALHLRRRAGHRPFTVLSCDNLPGNGALLRGLVLEVAMARDPGLADWIGAEGRFPSTMVDRITPATTQADVAALAEAEGYDDPACVLHEPFRQWVIEDDFVDGSRPAWEAAGAQLVQDVDAFETMKLRCLNGTHSALAYLGYLGGYQTVGEAVADPSFAGLCQRLWHDEILPTLKQPEGEDLPAYCTALLERYRNPGIQHRTWQIAMDGSQKLPQRILGTVQDRLEAGAVPTGLCLAVAGWMRYVGGVDEAGQPIDVRDPLASDLATLAQSEDPVAGLLSCGEVFSSELAADPRFAEAVQAAYGALVSVGARKAVADYAAGAG